MENETIKTNDDVVNSSEVEDCESNAKTEEIIEKVDEVPFKKPVLVGKIGRLPKKMKSFPTPVAQKNDISSVKLSSEPDVQEPKEPDSTEQAISKIEVKTPSSTSIQYKEPSWSGPPRATGTEYFFEVLKEGAITGVINLMSKNYWIFGRLINCDVVMQHPTVSRYHAVLQYRAEASEEGESGFYIYDLGSTHGTFLNKRKLKRRVYVRVHVGHMLKLGCSTKSYLLNGPEEDAEKESELSVTELKQKRLEDIARIENEKKEEILRKQKEEEERKKREEERGVDWGMGEDADEETDLAENPYAQTTNEDLYLDDPKKTLRGYFEREGLELEYDCSEQGMGQFLCKVELPIDDERGRAIYAEVVHKGKKKDAVIQCALEACRILDRHGVLRQAVHESRKRKAKDWAENDYYDSDDDTFLDRTGSIEKKREKRMNAKNPQKAETYESLIEQEKQMNNSIKTVEKQLREAQEKNSSTNNSTSEEDSLDAFMKDLKDTKPDKSSINKLKYELTKLKQEHAKIIKLVNVAKPATLPPLVPQYASDISSNGKSKVLPIFGKRKKVPVSIPQKTSLNNDLMSTENMEDEEEEDEEETDKEVVNKNEDKDKEKETDKELINRGEDENKNTQRTESDEIQKREKLVRKNLKGKSKQEFPSIAGCSNEGKMNERDLDESLNECQGLFGGMIELIQRNSSSVPYGELSPDLLEKYNEFIETAAEGAMEILAELDKFSDVLHKPSHQIHNSTSPEQNKVYIPEEQPSSSTSNSERIENNSDQINKKIKNRRRIQSRQEKVEIDKQKGYQEDAQKEDYNMWVPPKDQKGDGMTKLNEKYGY